MHISSAEKDEGRVDLLLEQIAASDDAAERADLLLDLSTLLEQEMGDPEGALRTARAALDECPELATAAGRVADLLEQLGQYSDLADFLADRLDGARASRDGRAVMARRLAEICERRLSDPTRAIAGWRRALAERPGDREALSALARLLSGTGQVRERLAVLAQLLSSTESSKERAALHRELAAGHQDLGHIELAAEHMEWALSLAGGTADDHRDLAASYLALGRVHAAIDAHVRRAELCRGAERAEVYLEIAALYEGGRRDPGRAIDFCRLAVAADPDHIGAARTLARLLEQAQDHDGAIAALERWASLPGAGSLAERAAILARAAGLARRHLGDAEEAARLYTAALEADPAAVSALRGLAELCRERGEHGRAAQLVLSALAACEDDELRADLAADAGELHEELGDTDGAAAFYRDALDADGRHLRAAARLAELLWRQEQHGELVGLLELLGAADDQASVEERVTRLERLACSYRALGLDRRAIGAARRGLALAPDRRDLRALEAELCFRCKMWRDAARAIDILLEGGAVSAAEEVLLHHRAGVAAARTGAPDRACELLGRALALDPGHRESLVELYELVGTDGRAKLDVLRALVAGAGPEERRELLVEIGDLLAGGLGGPGEALAAYQEALALAPEDHILIHKCLDVLAAERRWGECLALFERLIASESDPHIRAKASHAAALLCRDELGQEEKAMELLWSALDDDPELTAAREALEEILRARGAWQALANLYLKLLAHHGRDARRDEDRSAAAERVRLWAVLGDLCWTHLGQVESALEALEVARRLAPDDVDRLRELAERAAAAGPEHRARAIALGQELLARTRQRVASYRALEDLYREAGLERHAAACAEAASLIAPAAGEGRARPDTSSLALGESALTAEMWTALAHPDEDPVVSAIFALVAPVVASAGALSRKRLVLELRGAEPLPEDSVAGRVLARVAASLGGARPEALACPEARLPLDIRVVADRGAVRPVLVLGAPLLSGASERQVAFHLGRALAALRGGGILRFVLPRAEQLAHLIDAALEMARGGGRRPTTASGLATTVRTLERGLTALQREQLAALARRLEDRALLPEAAARDWLRAHDLSIARVGLVACGDLATAVEVLRADPPSAGHHAAGLRCQEIVWSSASEPILDARAHLEAWYAVPEAARSVG